MRKKFQEWKNRENFRGISISYNERKVLKNEEVSVCIERHRCFGGYPDGHKPDYVCGLRDRSDQRCRKRGTKLDHRRHYSFRKEKKGEGRVTAPFAFFRIRNNLLNGGECYEH